MGIRVISGLIGASILFSLAWVGGWIFFGFVSLIVGICLYEYCRMTLPDDVPSQIFVIVSGLALFTAIMGGLSETKWSGLAWIAIANLPILWFLFRPGVLETAGPRLGLTIVGLFWVPVFTGFTAALVLLENGFFWLLLACALSFGSDIGALFAGKAWGRHKLYVRISPAKTWEGAVGGVGLATLLSFIFVIYLGPSVPLSHLVFMAPLISVFGQCGDLAQSLLKRSVGVKDSGKIMPGHGGFFDRMDALLFVGPPLFIYAHYGLGIRVYWLMSL